MVQNFVHVSKKLLNNCKFCLQLCSQNAPFPEVTSDVVSECEELLERMREVRPQHDLDGIRNVWIIKPGSLSRGRGKSSPGVCWLVGCVFRPIDSEVISRRHPNLLSLVKDVELSFHTLPTGNRTLVWQSITQPLHHASTTQVFIVNDLKIYLNDWLFVYLGFNVAF